MERRAVVIKMAGDPQIAGAIAEGISANVAPEIKGTSSRVQRSLLRVAVGNTHTPEDYDNMVTKARGDYYPSQHGRLYGAILGVWALVWFMIFGAFAYLQAWNRSM